MIIWVMGIWLVALVFFYNGDPVFSLSFYVLKLVSAVHFNESANTALLKCTEANSVCVCFSVTGLDVRKYGNAELRVRAIKLTQIKVIFLPSREKICFSTTGGEGGVWVFFFFFLEEQTSDASYNFHTPRRNIYIALSIDLENEDFFPPSLMMFYSLLTCVFIVKLGLFC